MKGATGGLDLDFDNAAVAGTDTVKVTLDGTTSGTLTVDNLVENVVLTTKNSAATLTNFAATGATTVAIKGGQGFKLDAANSFLTATTIDAREAGKAEFTAAAATTLLTGSTDDKITFITKGLAATDLINLGAGNDTLVLNVATNNAATLIGVENVTLKATGSTIDMKNADQKAALTFEGAAAALNAIAATELASGSTVTSTKNAATTVNVAFRDSVMGEKTTIDLQEGATGAVTVTNIKDATINYGKASVGAITLDANATGGTEVTTDLTVNAKGALSAFALTNLTELKNLTVNAEAGVTASGGTFAKLETLTINTTKSGSFTLGSDITASNAAGVNTVKLDATAGAIDIKTTNKLTSTGSIKDVSIVGNKDVKVELTSSKNVDKLVSTSTGDTDIKITNGGTANEAGSTVTLGNAATGKTNTLSITGDQKQSVIGGTGVDAVTVSGKGASTITLGAGNDKLTVDSGSINNITLGAGKDVVTISAVTSSGATDAATLAEKHTIITDFKGAATDGDTIKALDSLAAAVTLKAVDLSGAAVAGLKGTAKGLVTDWGTVASTTLADKITAVNAAAEVVAADNTIAFLHEGKTYLFIEGATVAAGAISTDDTLIELTGISASTGITFDTGVITNIA